jgi:hypothetical protein
LTTEQVAQVVLVELSI